MKRRAFLNILGKGAVIAAVGVPVIAVAAKKDVITYSMIEEQVRELLRKDVKETMDQAAFEQMESGFVPIDRYGEYGGVRYIESPMIGSVR